MGRESGHRGSATRSRIPVTCLQEASWSVGRGQELAIVLEESQQLTAYVSAHVVVKPSYRVGEVAARQIIKWIRGYQGDRTHEIVCHEVRFAQAPAQVD